MRAKHVVYDYDILFFTMVAFYVRLYTNKRDDLSNSNAIKVQSSKVPNFVTITRTWLETETGPISCTQTYLLSV